MILFIITSILIFDFCTMKSDHYGYVKNIEKISNDEYQITFSTDDYNFYKIIITNDTAIFDVGYGNRKSISSVKAIDVGDIIDVKYRLIFTNEIRWIFLHNSNE